MMGLIFVWNSIADFLSREMVQIFEQCKDQRCGMGLDESVFKVDFLFFVRVREGDGDQKN